MAVHGKEKALELRPPFDEEELLAQNKDFIFENMSQQIKNVSIIKNTDESMTVEGLKNAKEAALPGKPAAFFY